MKIAITGATGFLGRYLVRQLATEGHQLRCWYRPTSDRSGMEDAAASIEWVPGALDDSGSCGPLIEGCDAVVRAALWRPGTLFQGAEGNLVKFADINTHKISALGMQFGGTPLLEKTIAQLLEHAAR